MASPYSARGELFLQHLDAVTSETQGGAAHWREHEGVLRRAAQTAEASGTLAAWREQMPALEGALSALLRVVPNPTESVIRRAYCPMAGEGAGAFWLQRGEEIANVYFGASMLRCGNIEAAVSPGARAE